MKVKNLALDDMFTAVTLPDGEREIDGVYVGDLLSWVMSKAKEGNLWLTVMGNVNSIGVAVLTDVACIVLTENAPLDDNAKEKAEQNGVIILTTDKTSYEVSAEFSKLQ